MPTFLTLSKFTMGWFSELDLFLLPFFWPALEDSLMGNKSSFKGCALSIIFIFFALEIFIPLAINGDLASCFSIGLK